MNTEVTGTVFGGALKLDQPLSLPDESRVRVTIHPVASNEGLRKALAALERLRQERPLRIGGERRTRDELYERG